MHNIYILLALVAIVMMTLIIRGAPKKTEIQKNSEALFFISIALSIATIAASVIILFFALGLLFGFIHI